ncbi:MAG: thioredoxin family protein [Gammaproteobacteria bacterium]|nr:thioredoxin family protein [Gammaproteobacteria bacterium]
MSLTPSTMTELGRPAPQFSLPSTSGDTVSLDDFADYEGLLVVFMCNHCPYVKHIKQGLVGFARDYEPRGIAMVGINANDAASHPADSPEKMKEDAQTFGYPFPYLYDEGQRVAKAYEAACTPDFFLYDRERKLVYRGQFDASRPGNDVPVTGNDLRAAADALLAGKAVPADQTPSVGCNIKWKAGNEPAYAA